MRQAAGSQPLRTQNASGVTGVLGVRNSDPGRRAEHQKRRKGKRQSGTAERLVPGEPGSVTRPCAPAAASCFDPLLGADTPPRIYVMCPYLKPVKVHRPSSHSPYTGAHGVSPRPHRAPRLLHHPCSHLPLGCQSPQSGAARAACLGVVTPGPRGIPKAEQRGDVFWGTLHPQDSGQQCWDRPGGQGHSRQGRGSRRKTARRNRQTQAQLFKLGREVAWVQPWAPTEASW